MPLPALRSPGFEAWVDTARARPALWRILLCLALAGAVWFGAVLGLAALGSRLLAAPSNEALLLLYLGSFAGLIAGLAAAARLLHARAPASLLGPEGRPDLRRLLLGIAAVGAIGALTILPLALLAPLERQLPLPVWLAALPLALPLVLIQATAEEAVFRGYLQTQLAARFASPLVWWVLPALAFGALHFNPGELGANAPLMVAAAALMGLVLGDVSARTGSLWLAIGLHFANNVLAMLIVATPSALSGLALYLSPLDPDDPAGVRVALLGNITIIALAYAAWLWWNARRATRHRG